MYSFKKITFETRIEKENVPRKLGKKQIGLIVMSCLYLALWNYFPPNGEQSNEGLMYCHACFFKFAGFQTGTGHHKRQGVVTKPKWRDKVAVKFVLK